MKTRAIRLILLTAILCLYALLSLGGCARIRQNFYDVKQYFQTDIARW